MTIIKVLIDDDILIQLEKQLEAEKLGYQLDCYFSVDEFLANQHKYQAETPIYFGNTLALPTSFLRFQNTYPISELVLG